MPDISNLATKSARNTKATEIKNKILNTSHFIKTQEFIRLIKIRFNTKIKETARNLAHNSWVDNALNLGDENRIKR